MKNTMIVSSMYHPCFDSGFVLSSIFAFLSYPIISVWKAVFGMGHVFLSVASLSRAVFGNVSKRGGGIFAYGDPYATYLYCLNSLGSLSATSDSASVLCA